MGNRIWLPFSHGRCKECKKDVEFYEFYHIRKDGVGVLVRACKICFCMIDFRGLTSMELQNIFPS
mgnify:CR=1 FL=1